MAPGKPCAHLHILAFLATSVLKPCDTFCTKNCERKGRLCCLGCCSKKCIHLPFLFSFCVDRSEVLCFRCKIKEGRTFTILVLYRKKSPVFVGHLISVKNKPALDLISKIWTITFCSLAYPSLTKTVSKTTKLKQNSLSFTPNLLPH